MIHQPFFWVYLLLLFQLFIFMTNRVSFHPPRTVPEPTWTFPWFFVFISILGVPSVYFLRDWDFTYAGLSILPFNSKLFLALMIAWILTIWTDHVHWALFRLRPLKAELIRMESIKVPAGSKAPFAFLERFHIHNLIYEPELVEYEVYVKGWPKELSGFTLVQISDLHFGKYITRDFLKAGIDRAKRLKPDMFALTGDFINFPGDIPTMRGLLKGFKAPLGVYAVLGNHDMRANPSGLTKALEADGIRVLDHEVVYHKRKGKTLAILGAQELWYGQKDDKVICEAKGDAKIFLAHHPDHFYLGKQAGAHLQLSGHTHGGQIRFPFIGPLIVPSSRGRKYSDGFYREKNTVLFVNRGLGCFPPLRTLCYPEIVKLVLKSA